MKKVGQFFSKMWKWFYPVAQKIEPVVADAVSVADPKLAPAIAAGQAAVEAVAKAVQN